MKTKKMPAKGVSNNFLMLLAAFVVIIASLTLTVFNKPSKPTSDQLEQAALEVNKAELASFVDDAAYFLSNWGDKAFPQFREKDSKWWKQDQYLFVYDLNGKTLVLPPERGLEGTNRWNTKDSSGKYYIREMINLSKDSNFGWVQYQYPKPGTTNPVMKLSYFRRVAYDGKVVVLGSGIYLK